MKERLFIAEMNVTTLREVTEHSRDHVPARLSRRHQEVPRCSDGAERDGCDDYDQPDERDDYRHDTRYSGGGRRYPVETRRRADGYADLDEDPYGYYNRDEDPYRAASSRLRIVPYGE